MRNVSILTYINIIFVIAFIAITSTFILFIKFDQEKYQLNLEQRYNLIAHNFLTILQSFPSKKQLDNLYTQYNVKPIKDRGKKLRIINNAQLLVIKQTFLGRARIYRERNSYYIYVQEFGYNILLKDLKPKSYNSKIALLIYVIFLGIFFTLYLSLKRRIYPLKDLDRQIQRFSNGETDIKLDYKNQDEIGKIANSFNDAITNINNLSKSKNLFMRNMMHELKTPITKGMFIAETIEDEYAKNMLIKAFNRMNSIAKELSTVEKFSSNIGIIHKEETKFCDLFKITLNLLINSRDNIQVEAKDFSLKVDIASFSIVLKNLIDNAIKFSPNSLALVKADEKEIKVISDGEELKNDLAFYTEPFSQEEKRNDGFGLGLYIVTTILNQHNIKLEYFYENNQNVFKIDLTKLVEENPKSKK